MAATKSFSTCSGSPSRSSPWSTNTQVSWSPMARCTRAAATAESTPPDSPQIDELVADLLADRVDLLVDDVAHRPGRTAAGDLEQEVLEHLLAVLGVHHLGVELHAGHALLDVLERRDRRALAHRGDREALGRDGHRVAVRHPHRQVVGQAGEQRRLAVDDAAAACRRTPTCRCGPPRHRAPAPSPGSRSRCRRPGRPRRTARRRPAERRRRTRCWARRTG